MESIVLGNEMLNNEYNANYSICCMPCTENSKVANLFEANWILGDREQTKSKALNLL